MTFKNFPTPHCHSAASLDTASTPERFAEWELAHETGALTVTDHGTLAGTRKVYDLLKEDKYKGKVRPILGLEAYFRDDDCEVLKKFDIRAQPRYRNESRTKFKDDEEYQKLEPEAKEKWRLEESTAYYQKYFHLTMHFLDQKAYEVGIKKLSGAEFHRNEKHGSEFKPLFNWHDLEDLGATNTVFCTGCLIGMIQRHVAFGGRHDIAEAYLQKILSIVKPENLYVEVFPHVCDRNWSSKVTLYLEDGTKMEVPPWKKLKTDIKYGKSDGIQAEDLYAAWGNKKRDHGSIRAVMNSRKWEEVPNQSKIVNVEFVEEFIQNECSPFTPDGDLQKPANEFMLVMAEKYKLPVLVSDDSHFVSPDEKVIQDIKLLQDGNWRFHNSYHRFTSDEAFKYFKNTMGKDEKWFEGIIDNNHAWASRFKDFKLSARPSLPTSFYPTDTLAHTWRLIQQHGRQVLLQNSKYSSRLVDEIKLLHLNGTIDLLPYFFIDEEVVELYNRAGEITGSGRGSAAGMLLAYLLEITHVDPLKYGLSMDRFLTIDRIQSGKLPDIDQDLPHTDLLMNPEDPRKGWLADRFGECFAQISTDTSIKLKSAILDVHRVTSFDRRVPKDVADLAHRLQVPPQGISDKDFVFGYDANGEWQTGSIETDPVLVEYTKRFPKEWNIVKECLGIPKGKGRHPCGVVITNEPVDNFIPILHQNGHKVTAFTANQVESAGALKMDFLRLKALQMIKHCIGLVQEKYAPELAAIPRDQRITVDNKNVPIQRVVPFQGKNYDLWDIPEDQAVFKDICEGRTDSVFQFGTPTAKKWLKNFDHWRVQDERKALDSIESIAAFTALDRPGPLDAYVNDPATNKPHNMLVEFARRARGEPAIGSFPILMKLFPETHGVLCIAEGQDVKTSTGLVKIENVEPGTLVQTENGSFQRVLQRINNGIASTVTVRMSNGVELCVTPEHEVFTNFGWVEAGKLTGRHIVKQFWACDEPIEIGDHRDWLVGLLLADGDLCATTPVVACGQDRKFAESVKRIADSAFGLNSVIYHHTRSWYVRLTHKSGGGTTRNPIVSHLRSLGLIGLDCYKKRFPDNISVMMLTGFFEGDGSVHNRRVRVKNQNLAKQFWFGLQRARVHSSFRVIEELSGTVYEVSVGKNIPCLIKLNKNNDGVDFVPNPKIVFDGKRRDHNADYCLLKKSFVRRETAYRLVRNWGGEVSEDIWGRVLSVRSSGPKPVYDLSVENVHSFVVGGSVVHNCYQEQLQKTFLEIGRTTPIQANDFRIHVGKKQMKKILADKAIFMPGAIESVGIESAEAIWASMETAGQYSFNKSHAVSYATDGYATAFLKHYFPTQWWTSVLSYSKKEDIQGKYWNQCKDLILLPDISKSTDKFQVEGEYIRAPLNLLTGVGPAAHEELTKYVPVSSLLDLATKIKVHKDGVDGKKRRSNLHTGIISSLIAGGAMDSLFEPGLSIAEKMNVWIGVKADVFGTRHKKTGLPKESVDPKFRNLTDLQQYQLKKRVLPIASEDLSQYITNLDIPHMKARKIQNNWFWSYDLEATHGYIYYLTQRQFIEEVNRKGFSWPSHRGSSINLCTIAYVIEQEKMYAKTDGKPRIQVTLDIEGFHLRTVVWTDKQTGLFPEPWRSNDLTGAVVVAALRKWNPDRDLSLDHTEVICSPFEFREESSKE